MNILRKIWRKILGRNSAFPAHSFVERDEAWQQFLTSVSDYKLKVQVGARGSKIADDWEAIDLFDTSDLIDHNYDLLDLPYEDGSIDVFVCNAVLEHVPEPELAIYEMWRSLKPGGQIWIEIPFMQGYHAHPHDYWRVTLRWCQDFDEVNSGIFKGFAREAYKMLKQWGEDVKLPPTELETRAKEQFEFMSAAEEKGTSQRLYTATWFWGKKPPERTIAPEKKVYLEYLKARRK